jgi:hypothetical protein
MPYSQPPNTVVTTPQALTDGHIQRARGDKANVVVGIGFIGRLVTILNPASAEAALARYVEIDGAPAGEGDTVRIIGFDDFFEAHDFQTMTAESDTRREAEKD